MKFSKLREESERHSTPQTEDAESADISGTKKSQKVLEAFQLVPLQVKDRLLNTLLPSLVLGSLLLIIFMAVIFTIKHQESLIINQINERLNNSATFQDTLKQELEYAGEKLNTANSEISKLKNTLALVKLTMVSNAQMKFLEISMKNKLNDTRRSFEAQMTNLTTLTQEVKESQKELQNRNIQLKEGVDMAKNDFELLKNRTLDMEKIIHERLDILSNNSEDTSTVLDEHRRNVFMEMDLIRSNVENLGEEIEQNYLHQSITSDLMDARVKYLEQAVNLTVSKLSETETNHKEFSNKTMSLLESVMETYRKQMELEKEESSGQPDEVSGQTTNQGNRTEDTDQVTCDKAEKLLPSSIICTASSEYSPQYTCDKAFDGILAIGKLGSAWASLGEGVGAWILATFTKPVAVKEIKILQRFVEAEANRKVEIEFDNGLKQQATLPAKGSRHWNIIRLTKPILTKSLKFTITEVYGKINNGFKEIAILGC